ncbi:MAG: acetate--CoA ligase family protein [Syntrophorhabdaceae bacterium]|nr:acetate--CoA ligase family protein [Syntrophorhabdaceae bacterium]
MEKIILNVDALDFLEKEGFKVLKNRLAKDEEEAAQIASEIGFPVSMKVCSSHVVHKTEVDGVRYPINNTSEVREAFLELKKNFKIFHPEKFLEGIMVQRLGRGIEMIVGVHTDQQFGPVIMFGLGGIFVEAIKDISFRMIPINKKDARDMIEELSAYKILTSPRQRGIDINLIVDFLIKVSQFITLHSEVREMDMNPVFVSAKGLYVCDARITQELMP